MPITKGDKALLDTACQQLGTAAAEDPRALHNHSDMAFADIRGTREPEREGMIPGAFHAPQGAHPRN